MDDRPTSASDEAQQQQLDLLIDAFDQLIDTVESISTGLKMIKLADVADQSSLLIDLAEISREIPNAMAVAAVLASRIAELRSHLKLPN